MEIFDLLEEFLKRLIERPMQYIYVDASYLKSAMAENM
jgi:hypothetical protein